MANELNVSTQINFAKDLGFMAAQAQTAVTIAGQKYVDLAQDILETATVVNFGDIIVPGFVMIQNLSVTDISLQIETPDVSPTDDFPILLKAGTATAPGGIAMFTLNSTATGITAIAADTGNWKITVRVFDV